MDFCRGRVWPVCYLLDQTSLLRVQDSLELKAHPTFEERDFQGSGGGGIRFASKYISLPENFPLF